MPQGLLETIPREAGPGDDAACGGLQELRFRGGDARFSI